MQVQLLLSTIQVNHVHMLPGCKAGMQSSELHSPKLIFTHTLQHTWTILTLNIIKWHHFYARKLGHYTDAVTLQLRLVQ